MRRQADEEAQAKAELEAAERVRNEREAAVKAREAAAAAAARELSAEIRKYNECGTHLAASCTH
jgi:membrane protein involved in colicin uptake